MNKYLKNIQDAGFTLIEVMISMGLLTFVMGISMNILSIVLELTNDADYAAVITQESNYASERVKRMVRSAETFSVFDTDPQSINGDSIRIMLEGKEYILSVTENSEGNYILTENGNSIMSSEVYIKQFGSNSVFTDVDGIGVRTAFEIYHDRDENASAGAFVYSQSIGRNAILN